MNGRRAAARQLLEDAGFDFDKTYLFTVEADAQEVARATFVQEQLRLIGIKTDFDLVATVAFRHQINNGLWGDILPMSETMQSGDPALGLGPYLRCTSSSNLWTPGTACDPISEGLLDQLSSTLDPLQRKAISDDLQQYAMGQYWKFPTYWEHEAAAFWPDVRGYVHHPTPSGSFLNWEHLWIDPAHQSDTGFSGQITGVPGGL